MREKSSLQSTREKAPATLTLNMRPLNGTKHNAK